MTFLFYKGVKYIGHVTFDGLEDEEVPFFEVCKELCGTEKTLSLYINDQVYSGITVRKEHVQ